LLYNQLVAINDRPLARLSKKAPEDRKLQRETGRRRKESAAARQKRIAEYRKKRHQDYALIAEMIIAFDYKLAATQSMAGAASYSRLL
jgi:hypothetical protein